MTSYDDWLDSLPQHIKLEQYAWDRARAAWKMRQAGLTYRAIADALGVSNTTVQYYVLRYPYRSRKLSPAERWCRFGSNDLIAFMKRARRHYPVYDGLPIIWG